MILLVVRTDKPLAEIGLYKDGIQLAYEQWEAHRQLAETLHNKIGQLLNENQLDWHNINGIVVYEGPGSFTGLRIGVSVANALGYGLKVPIIGSRGEDWIEKGCIGVGQTALGKLAHPFYGNDVNITTPKK